MTDVATIRQLVTQFFPQIVEIRRYLHQHPELSGKEIMTSRFICKWLDNLQIPHEKDVAGHGVVALLAGKGKKEGHKTVALRADMDALPIQEQSNAIYHSVNEGVMHACGHDVHMASLLGTLMVLNRCRDSFSGNVKAVFQPSEEEYEGGAPFMIEAGVLQNPPVDVIFGLHATPELKSGTIGLHAGEFMASTDEIHLTVLGKGGHAALVRETINPVMIASKLLLAIDNQVYASKPPHVDMVLSFGRFMAAGSTNIIPDKVTISGTFRTFDETWRKEIVAMITTIARTTARDMGGDCDVLIKHGYPVLKNDISVTENVKKYSAEILGSNHVQTIPKRMTAEDFAYYLQKTKGTFIRLGTQSVDGQFANPLHSATFDVDERSLQTAVEVLSQITLCELAAV